MDEERFNPFSQALANVGVGIKGLMRSTPAPPRIREAVDLYNQRVDSPDMYQMRAIYELHGLEGAIEYVQSMENQKRSWGI